MAAFSIPAERCHFRGNDHPANGAAWHEGTPARLRSSLRIWADDAINAPFERKKASIASLRVSWLEDAVGVSRSPSNRSLVGEDRLRVSLTMYPSRAISSLLLLRLPLRKIAQKTLNRPDGIWCKQVGRTGYRSAAAPIRGQEKVPF